jgi:hypothetical protein
VLNPVFRGGARFAAALILILGPLLQVIEFVLEYTPGDAASRVASWAAHPAQVEIAKTAGFLAVPFLLGGTAIFVALTQAASRRLALVAGALSACALVGLAAAQGYEMAAFGLLRNGDLAGATAVLANENLGLLGGVFLVTFLGGASLGVTTMAIAVWRSPLVPRIVAPLMIAFAVLDFAVQGQGVLSHVVNLIGWSIAAGAIVVGYSRTSGGNGFLAFRAAAYQPAAFG